MRFKMGSNQPPDTASPVVASGHCSAAHLHCKDKDLAQEVAELLVDLQDIGGKTRYFWIILCHLHAVRAPPHTQMLVSLASTTMNSIQPSGAAL
jgi:hypothetical protein